eukprot:713475-Pelagomonas_calceolata.AAC.6
MLTLQRTASVSHLKELCPAVWADRRKWGVLSDGDLLWQAIHGAAAAEHHLWLGGHKERKVAHETTPNRTARVSHAAMRRTTQKKRPDTG